jgi:hypothetical protein
MKPSWDKAPTWANYLAQDKSGCWWWYEKEPELGGWRWEWGGDCATMAALCDNDAWKSTKEKRPSGAVVKD